MSQQLGRLTFMAVRPAGTHSWWTAGRGGGGGVRASAGRLQTTQGVQGSRAQPHLQQHRRWAADRCSAEQTHGHILLACAWRRPQRRAVHVPAGVAASPGKSSWKGAPGNMGGATLPRKANHSLKFLAPPPTSAMALVFRALYTTSCRAAGGAKRGPLPGRLCASHHHTQETGSCRSAGSSRHGPAGPLRWAGSLQGAQWGPAQQAVHRWGGGTHCSCRPRSSALPAHQPAHLAGVVHLGAKAVCHIIGHLQSWTAPSCTGSCATWNPQLCLHPPHQGQSCLCLAQSALPRHLQRLPDLGSRSACRRTA